MDSKNYFILFVFLTFLCFNITPILSCTCKTYPTAVACKVYLTTNGTDSATCGNDFSTGCFTIEGSIQSCQTQYTGYIQYINFYFGNGTFDINNTIVLGETSYQFQGQGDNTTIFNFQQLQATNGVSWTSNFYNNAETDFINITFSNFNNALSSFFQVSQGAIQNFTTLGFDTCIFENNNGQLFNMVNQESFYQISIGSYATLKIQSCTFTNNINSGIYTKNTMVNIQYSQFNENTYGDNGLLFISNGGLNVTNTVFNQNTNQGSNGLINGFNQTIENNSAYLVSYGINIASSTFENNFCNAIQGSICSIINTNASYVTLNQNTFTNNTVNSILNFNDIAPNSGSNYISSSDFNNNIVSSYGFIISNSQTTFTNDNQIQNNTFDTNYSIFFITNSQQVLISSTNLISNTGFSGLFLLNNSKNISINNINIQNEINPDKSISCTDSSVIFNNISILNDANTNQLVSCTKCKLSSDNNQITNCTIPLPTTSPSETPSPTNKDNNNTKPPNNRNVLIIIISIVGTLFVVGIIVFIVIRFKHKIFKHHHHSDRSPLLH